LSPQDQPGRIVSGTTRRRIERDNLSRVSDGWNPFVCEEAGAMSVEQSLMITLVCVAINTILGSSLSTLYGGGHRQRQ
jgi:hypothetical protein